jgi:hypothetical protein
VLEEALQAHVVADEAASELALVVSGFALLVLFACALAGTAGLFLFRRWGRRLSTWTSILALSTYPFLGPFLHSGWGTLCIDASMMLWGAALAMAYFSPIRARFERHDTGRTAPPTIAA